ncbi:MarR family winged helix-turn-helix transcriptional regulator [Pseudoruegeria sp. HB172150]|uniref:MarR family winged helix-turn-helix transcriptional regulator n=1 Tax=Pseudoruegeria sp. HB172150 TaxID=2721164 RepID=UPI0015540131|nr:MarR family transcriptional regulator [Pseudoruegeria sp. HB172150]
MDKFDPLTLDRQICFPLYAASNLLTRKYREVLAPLGLTYPQYLVMLVLWERAPRSVGELGEKLHLDSGTLTPLLKRMEAAGHVRRSRDPRDERRVQVELTDAGRALKEKAAHVPETLFGAFGMTAEEIEDLRIKVQGVVRHLSDAETDEASERQSA